MKKLLPLFLFLFCFQVHAQIIAPATVCAGTSVSFTSTVSAVTYSWEYATLSVNQPISPLFPFYTPGGSPTWICFNNDGGHYYAFLVDYATGNVTLAR